MSDIANGEHIEDLTIRDLFALSAHGPSEVAAGLESKDFENLNKKISSLSEPIPWSRVQSEVAGVFPAAMNTGLLDAWACAWKKYQNLKDDVEESRKSPDAIVLSRLAEHSIDSTFHPYVEIFLGSKRLQKITFENQSFDLCGQSDVFGVKNGCIVSLQLAKCEWTGSIATKGVPLVKRKLTKLDLPGRITLKRGIPLGSRNDN